MTRSNGKPPASVRLAAEEMRGAESTSHQEGADERSFFHGDDSDSVGQAGESLRALLETVDSVGWNGPAGRAVLELLRRESRREAARWVRQAGSLDEAAVAAGWETADEWLRSDRSQDPIGWVRRTVRRVMEAEAGAVQTGMGDPVQRRKLVKALADMRAVDPSRTMIRSMRAELDESLTASLDAGEPSVPADQPAWLPVIARMLQRAGWAWPQSALTCLQAVWMATASGRKRSASAFTLPATGVPAETWSALALLVAGSGPGCKAAHRWPGARGVHKGGKSQAICESPEVRRIVRHAVAGSAVRSSRPGARGAAA